MADNIMSNWDPYQELIDLRLELDSVKTDLARLANEHNKMLRFLQQQQQLLGQIQHHLKLDN